MVKLTFTSGTGKGRGIGQRHEYDRGEQQMHSVVTCCPLLRAMAGREHIQNILLETIIYYFINSEIPLILKHTIIFRYTIKEKMLPTKQRSLLITDCSMYLNFRDVPMRKKKCAFYNYEIL